MNKDVLEQIARNPKIAEIGEVVKKAKYFDDFSFGTRVCPDPKYGEIPTLKFRLKYGAESDSRFMTFYSQALSWVLDRVDIPNARKNVTITYAHEDIHSKGPHRNVDIYLKMPGERQAEAFDKLAGKFLDFLGLWRLPFSNLRAEMDI